MNALVSVVTRTLGRPMLSDAAASVRDQTYRPIEWIVVDAAGSGIAVPDAGDVPVRYVGVGRRLGRAAAMNAGLDAATGRFLMILDDDDLLLPAHVSGLVAALAANQGAALAYADVDVRDERDATVGAYAWDYSLLNLTRQNLFPPNAALFDSALVRSRGCRVDETLEYFEDWDFWLQAARHTPFVHHPCMTAIYRRSLSQSGVAAAATPSADPRCNADLERVQQRYAGVRRRQEDERDRVKGEALSVQMRGDLAAAAALWRAAYALDTADVEVLLRLAAIATRNGDHAAAANAFAYAARLAPNAPEIHWHHALALDAAGNARDARAARARAQSLDPDIEAKLRRRRGAAREA